MLGPSLVQAQGWSYKEAAKPYAGTSIRVLDEITPLQETMKQLVPLFEEETGIKVDYELLGHADVINKGQADLFSGRGYYDGIMLHGLQMGPLLAGKVLEPIDGFASDAKLANPALDASDFLQPAAGTLTQWGGKHYGYLTWNYNQIYWARKDLLEDPQEQAAFKARYGYDLAPAKTMDQLLDIAEFFTRKSGQTLAGKPLASDFYGIVMEGIPAGTTFTTLWENFLVNWGGGLYDAQGRPHFDSPENIAAMTFWAKLWKYAPPGQAEYSLVDVPTVMGNGIAAQSIAWSDFVLGIDKPGASALAGQFVYGGIPRNPAYQGARHAGGEPSLIAISKASKKKEATFLFLQWLVDKETQAELIAKGAGGVPIRSSVFGLPALQNPETASLYGAMKDTLEVLPAKPKLPKFFEIDTALAPIVQQVGLGRLTPEQAAKQGQAKLVSICGDKCTLDQ
ncbi:extracellular solute-binding protein [Corticibacter populi]|uniref:Extracellular solute-binding protein n=1 Tax=Corticibacter populi TaxID=1550736 RepID=A0A3M6QP17_9BURK|nr:extracellular solute-binding protein [Corticibacter populi]RMX04813.1 extracellular solute-binding protein [Corticibacter populi]